MNVLMILNERPLGSHPDHHRALATLHDDGVVGDWSVYPFLQKLAEGLSSQAIAREITAEARRLDANVLVWVHTGKLEIDDGVCRELRARHRCLVMLYWEADVYHPWYKPMPAAARRLAARCDTVFAPCGGPTVTTFARAGCRTVRYAPLTASAARFPLITPAEQRDEFDVVMIANRNSSRIPGKTMPGVRLRERLVRVLEKRYGSRFAVFGIGWSGRSAKGPCAFDEQRTVYAASRAAVGIDSFQVPYYFSDRLPIAWACGVPIVHGRNPGWDEVLDASFERCWFDDAASAIRRLDAVLHCSGDEREAAARQCRTALEEGLESTLVMRNILEAAHGGPSADAPAWARLPALWRA